ncbi:MAG: phosphohydrolase [Candidatus Gottesmanbacteria bacterium]
MINREDALNFIKNKVPQENIVKHMLACEALMGGVYDHLLGKGVDDLGGTKEEWMIAGLIHDGDYCPDVSVDKQGIQIVEWLKEAGYDIHNNVAQTTASHNWHNTGNEPKSLMDWALFCGDTLTGLIVATTLVRPERKLALVEVDSVMKKFKDPSFAAGTRRNDIKLCEEKLSLPLERFIDIGLKSMQGISNKLGL